MVLSIMVFMRETTHPLPAIYALLQIVTPPGLADVAGSRSRAIMIEHRRALLWRGQKFRSGALAGSLIGAGVGLAILRITPQ
jgi:hypothetical protein